MCGIVGAIAERDITPILLEGLRRLEYRGYDSAGLAVLDSNASLQRVRKPGKVAMLEQELSQFPMRGNIGIAHTRWATHGEPSEKNAHPHICNDTVSVVHNGIIENHDSLREQQRAQGYTFSSDTDTETIAHQVYEYHIKQKMDLLAAVRATVRDLQGAYALGVVSKQDPDRLITARKGSPLVIGIGIGEHFIASDVAALLPVTRKFIFLEEGDVAELARGSLRVFDASGAEVEREVKESELSADAVELGQYRHYMQKEIFEQPRAIADTLEGRIVHDRVVEESFGHRATEIFDQVKEVRIIACGTSFHAGLIASYWFESLADIPCRVEVASEFRYRQPHIRDNTLIVTISQSGETADTLAALKEAQQSDEVYSLAVCNVAESSLTRESDLVLLTRAGPEIGVASTKAFTTQLTALLLLVLVMGRRKGLADEREREIVHHLEQVSGKIEKVLEMDESIRLLSEQFGDKYHALFLGRGTMYPVAMEGALKLKEISYIHAESYPAGELKHGPLALVDSEMPVIAVAPNNELLEKLKSNLQEVRARGGRLYVFADANAGFKSEKDVTVLDVESIDDIVAPIIFSIPLQLLSYHVAVIKGTDVDKPRNLAKAVTVE